MAKLHSEAVDAPKTGKYPKLPREARVEKYPDFMMKSDKPSYLSSRVLGKLYRECRSFKETIEGGLPSQCNCLDNSLLVPGFQNYVETAREMYENYTDQLRTIINLYGIESEPELLTGCFHRLKNRLGREKTDIAHVVGLILQAIREKFKRRYFKPNSFNFSQLLKERISNFLFLFTHQFYIHLVIFC